MTKPRPGMKFIIPYKLVRPVEHGECLPDGYTKISNLRNDKWWAKPEGLDQKEAVVCLNGSIKWKP